MLKTVANTVNPTIQRTTATKINPTIIFLLFLKKSIPNLSIQQYHSIKKEEFQLISELLQKIKTTKFLV